MLTIKLKLEKSFFFLEITFIQKNDFERRP